MSQVKEWLTRQEAAEYTGFSVDTLDRYRSEGHINTYRATGTSRAVRLRRSELDSLFQLSEESERPLSVRAS